MDMYHIQETFIYCCKCKKDIAVSRVTVPDGQEFLKYNPLANGWQIFTFKGVLRYICPKHSLKIHMTIDNELYKD
jgi:hypothetical protein